MTNSSDKAKTLKGILMMVAPPLSLTIVLLLKAILTFSGGGSSGALSTILNIIALISAIAVIILVPIGVIFLVKKGSELITLEGGEILASSGRRWLAQVVDSFLIWIPAFLVSFLVSWWASGEISDTPSSSLAFWLMIITVYIFQAYYLTIDGQTIAKKLFKIQVIDAETHKVGGFVKTALLRFVFNSILSIIPIYALADALFIFRNDRRCIHDFMAGTVVINAKNRSLHAQKNIWVPTGISVLATLVASLAFFIANGGSEAVDYQ